MRHLLAIAVAVLLAPAFAAADSESVFFDEESDVTALVEKGDEALKKGDWEGAIDAWQRVLGDFPNSVLPAEDGIWLPATVTCSRKLAALPPQAIAAYRDRFEMQAAQKLALGTAEGLRTAAERFFCTDSGGVAMERLGGLHADAGSIELAMRCWEEVVERHPAKKATPATVARLGLAYVRLGFQEKANALVEKFGELKVRARGVPATVAEVLKEALAAKAPPPRTSVILPDLTFGDVPESAPEPRSVKWRLELGMKTDERVAPNVWVRRGGGLGSLQTYPSVAGGKLFVNLGRCLIALDSATGEFQWRIGEPLGDIAPGKAFKLPEGFFQSVTPEFWGHRWYAVISDGVLYANLTKTGKWCQLRAIRVKDARLAWGPEAGIVPDFDLTGPPMAWNDHVYVGGTPREETKRGEVWLFAFNRKTGALEWKTFISAYQQQGNRWGGASEMPVFAPVIAASGSYVYICTNNGALACVGHTGQIVWATKYPKPANYNPWGWMEQVVEDTWDLSPIFASGRDLVFLPADGTHCCRVDALTGRGYRGPADTSKRVDYPLKAMSVVARERCRHLVAIRGDVATLLGKECKEYDLKDPRIVDKTFAELPDNVAYCGRGLVTASQVFVPVRGAKPRLFVFDRKFVTKREIPWPAAGSPGTLMLAGKLLLSVSPHEIVALSDEPPKEEPEEPNDEGKKPGEEETPLPEPESEHHEDPQ